MSEFNYYFIDPCEHVAIVYQPDGITELGRYSFRGYMRGMNRFFQICTFLTWEMSYLGRILSDAEDVTFKTFANVLRSDFYGYVKRGEAKTLEDVVRQRITDLKQYKFKAQRIFPFLPESSATSLDYKEFEITVDRIFKWIQKMRQQRIIFYECILQEYMAQKDQYNQRLRAFYESEDKSSLTEPNEFIIDSMLFELGIDSENKNKGKLPDLYYEIHNQSWYLKDLLELDNPEIERYTKKLPRYRTRDLHADPEDLRVFFELFSVFKDEMSLILPDEPNKSSFERVLTVLIRDFGDDFEQHGDLENVITNHIKELEKYEFLSLPKEQFFDKLSKMIYDLRARRIAFYEAVLADYLANKEKYDNAM